MLFYHKWPENYIPCVNDYPQLSGIKNGKVYWYSFNKVLKNHGIFTYQSTVFTDLESYFENSFDWPETYEDYEDLYIDEFAIIGRCK